MTAADGTLGAAARSPANRLDRMIERLTAQRACLAYAVNLIAAIPGPVLEIGLGKGRTYDFLRTRLRARTIFAFDRGLYAAPDCRPDGEYLILGELRETIPRSLAHIGAPAALAHVDIGSDDHARDIHTAGWLGAALAPLMAPGGVLLADRDLAIPGAGRLTPPECAGCWPYFLYRMQPGG